MNGTPSIRTDRCPACQAEGLHSFYAINGIPSHCMLLMESPRQAINCPRGDLELACCPACGFITNRRFDASLNAYSREFEESQHFSEAFDSFAQRLARDLVERFGIRNKTVLEIGCGKGDFLALLCRLGDNRGIGIDPSCRPERVASQVRSKIRWFPEQYGPQHAQYAADVVCCRHTLEHIGPVGDFLQQVRRFHAKTPDTLVFIEVPDMARVLRELAFWDIYYEHCSYFTMDSLRRLFVRYGFEILDTQMAFGGQYLLLTARPCADAPETKTSIPDDLSEATEDIKRFEQRVGNKIEDWRNQVVELYRRGRNPVLWGGGSKAVAFLTTMGLDTEIACVVDINPHKQGKFLPGTGHAIIGPESLKPYRSEAVIVMNPIYHDEIRTTLHRCGIAAELIPLR